MDLKQLLPAKRKMIAWTIVAFVFGTMMSVQYHDVELGGQRFGLARQMSLVSIHV